jgi:hypothetical protein
MLVGKPKSVLLDTKHYRTVRKMARTNHLKIYETLHTIIDQHCERMSRLEELKDIGGTKK